MNWKEWNKLLSGDSTNVETKDFKYSRVVDEIQDNIRKFFNDKRKEHKNGKEDSEEWVISIIDSWLEHTSSIDYVKQNNLNIIMPPKVQQSEEKEKIIVEFVTKVKTILEKMRGHRFFQWIPDLREQCLSDRYLWYTWPLFSTNDRSIDGLREENQMKLRKTRTMKRCRKIKKEFERFMEDNSLDDSSFEMPRCNLCKDTTKYHPYKEYTRGVLYQEYMHSICLSKKVKCMGCFKKLMILNKEKYSRFLTMLVTSVTPDAAVKALITSDDGFFKYTSARDVIEDLIETTGSFDLFRMKEALAEKTKTSGTGLYNKTPKALLISSLIIYFLYSDRVLDFNANDWNRFPEIGVKKAYVIEDIYRTDIDDLGEDGSGEVDLENDYPKIGVDTHLQKLIDLWGWVEEYNTNVENWEKSGQTHGQTIMTAFFKPTNKQKNRKIEKNDNVIPRSFTKWGGKRNVLKSNLVSRIFSDNQILVPFVNSAIVDVCQLFQDKKVGIFLGIGFLEILSAIENGLYMDYVKKWYWKEFHFTPRKAKTMTHAAFQKEVNERIATARKNFFGMLFGNVVPISEPAKKKSKKTRRDHMFHIKSIITALADYFHVTKSLRRRWEIRDWENENKEEETVDSKDNDTRTNETDEETETEEETEEESTTEETITAKITNWEEV